VAVELLYLELDKGKSPYRKWESELDSSARAIVWTRINRVRLGNFGDCEPLKGKGAIGLYELRIHTGPGYRIYFGKIKDAVVIILCAGDKGSQALNIKKAKEYWQLYKNSFKKGVKNG